MRGSKTKGIISKAAMGQLKKTKEICRAYSLGNEKNFFQISRRLATYNTRGGFK